MRLSAGRMLLATALLWTGADLSIDSLSPAQTSDAARNGGQIFSQSCASCHSVHTSASLTGPSLKGYYSSHLPRPTDATVRATILQGKGKMPKFSSLSKLQTDDLIAYLKTL